jgi:hypothetical protein
MNRVDLVHHGRDEIAKRAAGLRTEFDRLRTAIEAEPMEDGITHPGEDIVAEIVATYGADALTDFILETEPPALAAVLLRLFGRFSRPAEPVRRRLANYALQSESVELRDALVQAVELWEDKEMIGLIAAQAEPVPWLADYIRRVAEELRG